MNARWSWVNVGRRTTSEESRRWAQRDEESRRTGRVKKREEEPSEGDTLEDGPAMRHSRTRDGGGGEGERAEDTARKRE